jgi:phosphoenolpyruvate synthase/pyruvate phosphate dikinase
MKWLKIISREYGVQYTEVSLRCLNESTDLLPFAIYEQVYIPDEGNEVCFFDEDKWNALVRALNEEYTSLAKLKEYEEQFIKLGSAYLESSKKISGKDLSTLSNSELKELYEEYSQAQLPYSTLIWTSFIINNLVSKKASDILSKYFKGKENEAELYKVALNPSKKAAVLQMQEDISGGQNIDELYEKYKWVSCLDLHNEPWTKDEFVEYIGNLKPLEEMPMSYSKILEDFNITDKDKEVIDIAKGFAYLKDVKDDFRRQAIFHALPLFREIARRMEIESKDVSYLLKTEILEGKPVDNSVINERKKGFTIYYDDKKINCTHGAEATSMIKELGISLDEDKYEEIVGTIASKGKAKGKVVLVRGVADLKKVEDGDIFVAVTTHPDYVAAMRKAAAIVTNEGGVTCHAAIVSREFKIPCIVGTNIATRVLDDGDLVEVDANLGFVRKI